MNKEIIDKYNNLFHKANDLYQQKEYKKALSIYQQIRERFPEDTSLLSNLGATLLKLGNIKEAKNILDKALSIDENHISALVNRGSLYKNIGEFQKSKIDLEKAVKLDEANIDANINLAFTYLSLEEYDKAWKHFEYRKQKLDLPICPYNYWNGNFYKNRTILIITEQGLGDAIWLSRFDKLLKEKEMIPIWAVEKPLVDIFVKNGIESFDINYLSNTVEKFFFDYYLYSFDLLKFLNITPKNIQNFPQIKTPYIATNSTLNVDNTSFNIGFAHAGNSNHLNDTNRSIDLEIFSTIFDTQNTYYAIQKEIDREKLISFGLANLFDTSPLLQTFEDTAAIINSMDLIITVDTSLAHLSGAMGKETWLLLPKVADWRWLQKGENTNWYPSIKIFRQEKQGEWNTVLEKVKRQLAKKIEIELV